MAEIDRRVMMGLGPFRFGMAERPYQQAARQWSFEYAKKGRLGGKTAQQYVTEAPQVITLSGVIYTRHGGADQIAVMAAAAGKGLPMLLADGSGRNWGQVVITRLSETATYFYPDGRPRKIEFDVELESYG
ncbi:P2 GpU family protein [Roseibium sp. TrichSKD4]|uniref:phage tail protein n=1 Tax=Roseibium sp. TrichSKD4 TaxID=744980 RepID=UPI0001E56F41|nr:phage tail protein [Roseibium sp. TrichSKD4]EFO31324.1 P2 GpU family protein [Roseibium sp. TrichSKD4]